MPFIIKEAIRYSISSTDDDPWSMTVMNRLVRYIAVITLEKMDFRPRLVNKQTGQFYPIATFEDVAEALQLMKVVTSCMRQYLMKWYNKRFLISYRKLNNKPNQVTRVTKSGKEYDIIEDRAGLSTQQIIEDIKNSGESSITSDELRKKYLYPLLNHGLIDSVHSKINGRESIYFPVREEEIHSIFDDDNDPRLTIKNNENWPTPEVIEQSLVKPFGPCGFDVRQNYVLFFCKEKVSAKFVSMLDVFSNPEICFKRELFGHGKNGDSDGKNCPTNNKNMDTEAKNDMSTRENKPSNDQNLNISSDKENEIISGTPKTEHPFRNDTDSGTPKTEHPEWFDKNSKAFRSVPFASDMHPVLSSGTPSRTPGGTPNIDMTVSAKYLRIQELRRSGLSYRKISKMLGVGLATIFRGLKAQAFQLKIQPLQTQYQQHHQQTLQSFSSLVPEFDSFASFDLEWHNDLCQDNISTGIAEQIYAFTIINGNNHAQVTRLHINHYNGNRHEFLSAILECMSKFSALVGFSILEHKRRYGNGNGGGIDGDIEVLKQNCADYPDLLDRLTYLLQSTRQLDIYKIYNCEQVKAFLEASKGIEYRDSKLETISSAILGEHKLSGVSGIDAEKLDETTQLNYCQQDTKLALQLFQNQDYELARIMYFLAQEVNQDFFTTCNYSYTTKWWQSKLHSVGYQKPSNDILIYQFQQCRTVDSETGYIIKGVYYNGGRVFDPILGLYCNVVTYDVSSMYPSMIYLYNLSTETINCSCCADDPLAKIPWSVMIIINTRLMKDKNKSNRPPVPHYWICRKKRGKLAEIMLDLYNKKMECKLEGNSLKEKAIKLLANSGYGAFGEPHFEFYDFRVAELVTAFAFYTISSISNLLVKKSGDPNIVIYGDTDSIFVNSESLNNKLDIENEVKKRFGVEMSKDKEWHTFAQFGKKEYSGVLSNGKYVTKQIYGMRDDKPIHFVKNTARLSSLDMIQNPNRKEESLILVKNAYTTMVEKVLSNDIEFIKQELGWSQKLSKDLIDYNNNDWHRTIYNEKLEVNGSNVELANTNSLKGSVQYFWKIKPIRIGTNTKNKNVKKHTMHPEKYELDLSQYKKDLWTCFENILIAYGFTNEELTQLSNQLIVSRTR